MGTVASHTSPWGQEEHGSGARGTPEQKLPGGTRRHGQEEQELGATWLSRDSPVPEDHGQDSASCSVWSRTRVSRVPQFPRPGLHLQPSCLSLPVP